jgi:hypothetical protein
MTGFNYYYRNRVSVGDVDPEALWQAQVPEGRLRLVDEDQFVEAEFDEDVFYEVPTPEFGRQFPRI